MNAKGLRILAGSICSAGLLMSMLAPPVAAACALNAPESVDIGSPLTIEGSGFPASTTVDVSITIAGGPSDELTVQSDGSGAFEFGYTPEAADAGVTTYVATAGADCTAQAVVAVGVDVVAETPEPTAAEAEAPPRTDMDRVAGTPATRGSVTLLLAAFLVVVGIGGLFATRQTRSR